MTEPNQSNDANEPNNVNSLPADEDDNDNIHSTTVNLGKQIEQATGALPSQAVMSEMESGAIVFYVNGNPQPQIVKDASRIILGRQSGSDETAYFFDLTSANALDKGVSRQHAAIHVTPQGYALEDLRSTNGTQINDERLSPLVRNPLRSGDRIQLGQLVITLYFSSQRVEIDTVRIYESDKGDGLTTSQLREGISTRFLMEEVSIYLDAISDIQMQLDVIRERPKKDVNLYTLRMNSSQRNLLVEMSGANEVIILIEEHVQPMKLLYTQEIKMLRTKTQLLGELKTKTQSGTDVMLSTSALELIYQNGGMPAKIEAMLDALVKRIIKAKLQDIDLTKNRTAFKKLRDATFVLLISSLTVSLIERLP